MPAPFEVCGEERRQNLVRFGGVDEASRHYQHVGVVVQPCQAGDFLVPAKSGADALMLVQRHADAVAASADGDARIAFARFHSRSQRMRIVRIVDACVGVCPEIFAVQPFFCQPTLDVLFQLEAGMVGSQSD